MENRVLETFTSSTGGTVEVFKWGIRHTAGKTYGGQKSQFEVQDDLDVTYTINEQE